MAFHQPTFAPPRPNKTHDVVEQVVSTTLQYATIDDPQEWILFSPSRTTALTQTTSTEHTAQTAGRSRFSDFGSLNTIARSGQDGDEGSEVIEDDEELDSLDDGLHAFQEPSMFQTLRRPDQSGGSILPVHDGLGTFAASSLQVQEQLWNFEHYNPHRRGTGHQRRRSSVQRKIDNVQDEDGLQMESTRRERIEQWRLEQSRVLLKEIEKETRRRRLSRTSDRVTDELNRSAEGLNKTGCTCEDGAVMSENPDLQPNESFWQLITRRVIRDIIGIDDSLLSVILGESLHEDESVSSTPSAISNRLAFDLPLIDPSEKTEKTTSWENRLLNRLAHELGVLVHQLSEQSGAFTTYRSSSTMDYAGIPVTQSKHPDPLSKPSLPSDLNSSSSTPHFKPTLPDHLSNVSESEHAARWGVEDESTFATPTPDFDYWERTPDVGTVFSYLQRRFASSPHPPYCPVNAHSKPNIATSNTPDSLRRAAIIRQHHPLITRRPYNRRASLLRQQSSPLLSASVSLSLKRPGSSCASWSTKKSRMERSISERNYWDMGGSGSGSGVIGGVGGWGEV